MEKSKAVINALMRRTKPATISQIALSADVSRTYTKELLMRLLLNNKVVRKKVDRKFYFIWKGEVNVRHGESPATLHTGRD